jgi:hypothetical protein
MASPESIAFFSGKEGPPRSRTVVKPRIRVRSAWALAERKTKPMSAVSSCAGLRLANITCQCASIRPGISTRPPQSISRAPSGAPWPAPATSLIRPSSIRRLWPPRKPRDLPSNSSKLVMTVGGAARVACARPGRETEAGEHAGRACEHIAARKLSRDPSICGSNHRLAAKAARRARVGLAIRNASKQLRAPCRKMTPAASPQPVQRGGLGQSGGTPRRSGAKTPEWGLARVGDSTSGERRASTRAAASLTAKPDSPKVGYGSN